MPKNKTAKKHIKIIKKKTTKKRLIEQLVFLHQAYLGFPIDGVAGVSNLCKNELKKHVKCMRKACAWKRYAKKLESDIKLQFGDQAILAMSISGKHTPEYVKMMIALKMASSYHFKMSTKEAYARLEREGF